MVESTRSELTPAELDRIEDALEELEREDDLDEASPIVSQRLVEYREILRMSRTALPMQEVPANLLDGVLEQARESADAVAIEPAEPRRASWWERWRTTLLIPGLAMATAAAVVLVIGEPRDETSNVDVVARAEPEKKVVEVESTRAPVSAAEPVEHDEPAAAAAPELEEAADEAERQVNVPTEDASPKVARDEAGGSPRWDIVARGDRARRAGDCKQASAEYAMALTDDDVHVRARAYAGLGLCDAAEGRFKEAADRYQRAKELDAEMERFIDEQRPRGSTGGGGKATRAKRAAPRPASSKSSAKPMPKAQQAFEQPGE